MGPLAQLAPAGATFRGRVGFRSDAKRQVEQNAVEARARAAVRHARLGVDDNGQFSAADGDCPVSARRDAAARRHARGEADGMFDGTQRGGRAARRNIGGMIAVVEKRCDVAGRKGCRERQHNQQDEPDGTSPGQHLCGPPRGKKCASVCAAIPGEFLNDLDSDDWSISDEYV